MCHEESRINYAILFGPLDHTEETVETFRSAAEEATAAQEIFRPAVVEGESALEAALSDGMFPVVDKAVDVFAVPSAPG